MATFGNAAGLCEGPITSAPSKGAVVRSEAASKTQSPTGARGYQQVHREHLCPVASKHLLNSIYISSCTENSPAGLVPGTGVFLVCYEAVGYCFPTV